MGSIKTVMVKTLANEIIKKRGNEFTEDFGKNKLILSKVRPIKSKKIRNVIAGYITDKIKRKNKPKVNRIVEPQERKPHNEYNE